MRATIVTSIAVSSALWCSARHAVGQTWTVALHGQLSPADAQQPHLWSCRKDRPGAARLQANTAPAEPGTSAARLSRALAGGVPHSRARFHTSMAGCHAAGRSGPVRMAWQLTPLMPKELVPAASA